MTDLKALFVKRGEQYQAVTKLVLGSMKSSLIAIEEFIELADNQTISWEDVGLTNGTGDGEVILVTGISSFEIGAKVKTNQGEIVVDEKNQQALRQVYRFGIPLEMAHKDSKDEVLAFLIRKRAEVKAQAEQATQDIQAPATLIDNQAFDLTTLSDDQRKSLELYQLTRSRN